MKYGIDHYESEFLKEVDYSRRTNGYVDIVRLTTPLIMDSRSTSFGLEGNLVWERCSANHLNNGGSPRIIYSNPRKLIVSTGTFGFEDSRSMFFEEIEEDVDGVSRSEIEIALDAVHHACFGQLADFLASNESEINLDFKVYFSRP